jgi:hypothetical protein
MIINSIYNFLNRFINTLRVLIEKLCFSIKIQLYITLFFEFLPFYLYGPILYIYFIIYYQSMIQEMICREVIEMCFF